MTKSIKMFKGNWEGKNEKFLEQQTRSIILMNNEGMNGCRGRGLKLRIIIISFKCLFCALIPLLHSSMM